MPKKAMLYADLMRELKRNDLNYDDLAELLGHSKAYISARMTGKYDWCLQDVYAIARVCNIAPGDIYKFFPPVGNNKNPFWLDQGGQTQRFVGELFKLLEKHQYLDERPKAYGVAG